MVASLPVAMSGFAWIVILCFVIPVVILWGYAIVSLVGRPDLDIGTTAVHLLALYQGLLVLVRAGLPRSTLHSVTDGAMASIGSLKAPRKQDDHE